MVKQRPTHSHSFCQNLHAKCYLNESLCVITSLNLHLYSQQNNNEMGVMVKRGSDQQMFFDITSEVDRLLRISESTHDDREHLVLESIVAEEPEAYAKIPTGKLAAKLGLQSARLYDKLIGNGYLEIKGGQKKLTPKGKEAGGEFRYNKGLTSCGRQTYESDHPFGIAKPGSTRMVAPLSHVWEWSALARHDIDEAPKG